MATNDELTRQARRVARDISLLDVAARLPLRVAYLWAVADFPPESTYVTWHRIARFQHVALFMFALAGLAVLIRSRASRKDIVWLLAFPTVITATHLIFHVEARFTLPVRPLVFVFAAVGMVSVGRYARGRSSCVRVHHT